MSRRQANKEGPRDKVDVTKSVQKTSQQGGPEGQGWCDRECPEDKLTRRA